MSGWLTLWALTAVVSLAPAGAAQAFDHGAFDRLLRQHVEHGLVDYAAFAASPDFEAYLASLAGFDPASLTRDERLAFWINAYNAYTIKLIVKHDERRSIRNINRKFGLFKGGGPWAERLVIVGGKTYDLETVEQGIIRPTFLEPRIHFALVCASLGCPRLRSDAYTGSKLEEQLDEQARNFLLESPGSNRVDVAGRTVYLSELFTFNDYVNDFGGSPAALMRFVAGYHPDGPERELLESGTARLVYTDYDWTLNSQELARRARGNAAR